MDISRAATGVATSQPPFQMGFNSFSSGEVLFCRYFRRRVARFAAWDYPAMAPGRTAFFGAFQVVPNPLSLDDMGIGIDHGVL